MKSKVTISILLFLFSFGWLKGSAKQTNAFSAKQAVDYALKNSATVKNALIDIQLQQQQNREITASAYPQITGSGSVTYNPNVAVQTFPNFIAAGTYGVLAQN